MPKEFVLNALKNIRRRYYHALTGTDVLKLGTLCLKHMTDPTPPKFKWASGSVDMNRKGKKGKTRYEHFYTLNALEYFTLFSSESIFHGVQYDFAAE